MNEFALIAMKLKGLVSALPPKPVNKYVAMVLEIHCSQFMNAMMETMFLATAAHKTAKSKNNFNANMIKQTI